MSKVKYKLLERTLIGNDLVEPGEVEFEGLPSAIFIPLCAEGKARRAKFDANEAERQRQNVLDAGRATLAQLDPSLVTAIRLVVREELRGNAKNATPNKTGSLA